MENAVDRCRKTLLILTPNWLENEWTQFETLLFQTEDPINRGRRLLPILAQNCTLPNRLKFLTHLDLTEPAEFDYQMQRLVSAIYSPSNSQSSTATFKQTPTTNTASPSIVYERGLAKLGDHLKESEVETRLNFAVLEWRLLANIHDEQHYTSSEAIRNERNRLMEELNRLAITHVGCSFNDLCKP